MNANRDERFARANMLAVILHMFECRSLTLLSVFNVCYYGKICELGINSRKCTETMNMSDLEPCVYARQRSRPGHTSWTFLCLPLTASGG